MEFISSVARLCLVLCDPMDCSTPGLPVHHQLPELAQSHVHRVSNAIHPSHPLSSPSPLPSIFPSIRVFFNESVLHIRWPEYWSFSFSISPSNEYSGLISFRIDWFDLLAFHRTLKNLLQYRSSKASVLCFKKSLMYQLCLLSLTLQPHGLQPTRLLCPWDSPGKNTGVGCHFLLWGIFPAQISNPHLLHCRQILYH